LQALFLSPFLISLKSFGLSSPLNSRPFDSFLFSGYVPSHIDHFSAANFRRAGRQSTSLGKEKSLVRQFEADLGWKKPLVVLAILLLVIGQFVAAQNLGNSPQFNVAVQGETGAQPEGSFLNFINWIGNVIAPVGAGGAVLGAVVSWLTGRGFGRWLFAAGALLAISGVTRLIEFWITNGTGGVT
jgi:hypothetical protein